MPISAGFYKKIHPWLMNEEESRMAFRPFITKGNPYKAPLFLISAYAVPAFDTAQHHASQFAEALLDRGLLEELYAHKGKQAPREWKGAVQFEEWLAASYKQAVVHTSLNTYQLETPEQAKSAKKEDAANFARGEAIFREVLEEFRPGILVLQGAAAFSRFSAMYAEQFVPHHPDVKKVQELEAIGSAGELVYENGRKAVVFATRSMSFFGPNGEKFEQFKRNLAKWL